jgi:SNF2 family DNA or RNA helicase
LLPKSRTIDHPKFNIAIKHTTSSVTVLRNLGYNAPDPILSQYRWPGKFKPFDHQRTMADFLCQNHRCFNLSEMGTGKTNGNLWASDWLMATGEVTRTLILSPLSTLERVWQQDIFDTLMHRKCSIVHGTTEQREKALAADVDYYILNHDGVAIKWLAEAIRRRTDINLVIIDEGSMFRNHDTGKYKALRAMLRPDMRVWWNTGTPVPNSPTDAWAQARIINPRGVSEYFGTFKRATMIQITPFKWAPKPGATEMAFEALQPAIRFKKSDCLDLPPVTYAQRQVTLTPEQRKAYDAMSHEMYLDALEHQQLGKSITAVNAADKVAKLRQILCGSVRCPDTGEYVTIPHGPRVKVLLEAIEQASAKVIVVVPFKGIIQALEKEISKHYSVGVLNGDVSPKLRNATILDFKNTPDPHVLLCHPKVMSHGLNLTEADTLVFYAPIYSNDEYQQVTERFNRAGQTRKMTIIRIGGHPIEWEIYKLVDNRQVSQQSILNLYETAIERQ